MVGNKQIDHRCQRQTVSLKKNIIHTDGTSPTIATSFMFLQIERKKNVRTYEYNNMNDVTKFVGITASIAVATSYASRAFASNVLKQGDVTLKSPGTQLEDALGAAAAAGMAGYIAHPRPEWAFWAGIPVATLAYTSIAEIPALRTSLANPTTPLLVIGGILASLIIGTF